MKSQLRNTWLPVVLVGTFVLLDLLIDLLRSPHSGIDLPHFILVGLALLTTFTLVRLATQTRKRAEATLRNAHDELESRVQERTAELERAHAELQQVNERLALTQAAAGAGAWNWDIPSGRLEWSPKMFDLFGLDIQTTAASFDSWRRVLHPEDREAAERRIDLALETHSDLTSEYRIIRPDGGLRWISALGRGFYDEHGQPSRMSGLCLDITDRKLAETKVEHFSSFPQLNPNPILEIDASGTITYHNAAAARALERSGLEDDARAFLPDDLAVILKELNQKKESTFQREVQVGGAVFSETVHVIPEFNVVRIYSFEITRRKQAEAALRSARLQVEAEKRHLEAVLQALPVGVIITDAQGGVLLTNGMDEQIWGPRPVTHDVDDYAQYKAWWADSGKPVEPHEWASAQAVEKGESVFGQVLEIQRNDGGHRFVLNSSVPIRDEEGRVIGSAVAIQDITELRRAEQALRESEERFRTVIENSRDGINMLNLETGRYVFMSPAQIALTGFSDEEMNNLPAEEAYERVHPDDREKSVSQQREIAEGRDQGSTIEYRWKVKSGEYRWFSDSRTLVRNAQGRPIALVGVSRDITDQKQAQEELRRREAELALASHERAITEERQRLARELHDSVSQALYGISLGVNTALTLLDADRDKVLEALNYSLSQTQTALAEMRALIFALRPEALATEGVVAALGRETAALIARRDVEIELNLCDEPDVSLAVKEVLYRIAQEAMRNAVKHTRCNRMTVRMTLEGDGLSLEVSDNGGGFDPQAAYPGHLGLRSMRERVTSVGGSLDISSAPDRGTQIRAHIPIPPAEAM